VLTIAPLRHAAPDAVSLLLLNFWPFTSSVRVADRNAHCCRPRAQHARLQVPRATMISPAKALLTR